MNFKFLSAVAVSLAFGLGTSAYAQGRHDDKPHGPPKKSAAKKAKEIVQPQAGRHDERPHGAPKMKETAKKGEPKREAGAEKK